jgi:mannose-6-phosphate isomerase-like protein (cupin superfamily)
MSGEIVEWRPGVRTRLLAAASTGATQLCLFEQWSEPGTGAPAHRHPGVEEAVSVLAGEAEFWVERERTRVAAGDTVVVPPDRRHGFANVGDTTLHTLAVFAAATPPVVYDDEPQVVYEVGGSGSRRRDAHRSIRDG